MPDELEIKIVRALNENARKSFREIAKEIGTSAPVVISKVKKLEQSGAIKGYIPVVDPSYFGYEVIVVIALRISHGKLIETQKNIAENPHVCAVYDVTGEWDSIVIARFRNREDLNKFVKNLLTQKYVDRTVTQVVLNEVKDEKRFII